MSSIGLKYQYDDLCTSGRDDYIPKLYAVRQQTHLQEHQRLNATESNPNPNERREFCGFAQKMKKKN